MFDCSFIPSYNCNLKCWFCMYDCGPDKKDVLDINKVKHFLSNIDLGKINQFGFYGGEISVNLDLYQKYMDLVPKSISRFTITNGSWSTSLEKTRTFLNFICKNILSTKVSSTPEHIKYQYRDRLKLLSTSNILKSYGLKLHIKENDDTQSKLLPMGRLKDRPLSCSLKCTRIPDGSIIFQNCDGVYSIVGSYKSSLEEIEITIRNIIKKKKKLINELLED